MKDFYMAKKTPEETSTEKFQWLLAEKAA